MSAHGLSSSLLRKLEGIIGDVVVTFELQLLDPSPFVYADPGKNPTVGVSFSASYWLDESARRMLG